MRTIKIILPIICMISIAACKKKNSDDEYYYGKWNVRNQQYTSPDTTYSDEVAEGMQTYEFKSNHTVMVVNPGIANVSDTWHVVGADTIDFGYLQSWQVFEKNSNSFKAKFYMNSNAHMTLTLEK